MMGLITPLDMERKTTKSYLPKVLLPGGGRNGWH